MTCSVPKHSQRFEPCLGLKVLFVPTLAKAHPDPKLSRVRVSEQQQHPEGAEQSPRSAQGGGFCFLLLFRRSRCPSWPRWGCTAAAAAALPPPAAGPALSRSGRGAAGRREREGGSRTRDPRGCPFCLMPVSLCFFDKNLKEERDGIRAMSRAGVGRC